VRCGNFRHFGRSTWVTAQLLYSGLGKSWPLYFVLMVLPAKRYEKEVDPRGLEPLASAMRRRSEGFAAVRHRSKNRLNKPNSRIVCHGCSPLFAWVVVKLSSAAYVNAAHLEAALKKDSQVYPTPVHVGLGVHARGSRQGGGRTTGLSDARCCIRIQRSVDAPQKDPHRRADY
jgi:hypothetical protein